MLAGTALSGPLTPPSWRSTNGQCDGFGTMGFPVMSRTVPHIPASVHLAQWFVISISSIRGDCTRHAIGSEHYSVQGLFTVASGYLHLSVLLMEEFFRYIRGDCTRHARQRTLGPRFWNFFCAQLRTVLNSSDL